MYREKIPELFEEFAQAGFNTLEIQSMLDSELVKWEVKRNNPDEEGRYLKKLILDDIYMYCRRRYFIVNDDFIDECERITNNTYGQVMAVIEEGLEKGDLK